MTDSLLRTKILIVDDSEVDRVVCRRYLEASSTFIHEILECELGVEALECCKEEQPDIMLLDYLLPDTNGLELLQDLTGQLSSPPFVIVLTGQGDEEVAVEAMRHGATDYLVKGQLTPEKLEKSIAHALAERNLQSQLQRQRQQSHLFANVASDVSRSVELPKILQTAVDGVRRLLSCDRILIYRFAPDMSGTMVAESVLPEWTATLGIQLEDNCFQGQQSYQVEKYLQGHKMVVSDIEKSHLSACHIKMLQRFQVKASLVAPIACIEIASDAPRLWGLLIAHHCQTTHDWTADELELLDEMSVQVAIAIQQAELIQNLKASLAEQKAVEQNLRKANARTAHFLQSDLIGILFANIDGSIQEANDEFLRIIGYSRQELQEGKIRWDKLTPPEQLHRDHAGIAEAQKHGSCTPYEKEYVLKDGRRVPVLVGYVLSGVDRTEAVAFVLDITERKQAERALQTAKDDLERQIQARTADLSQTNLSLQAEVTERIESERKLSQTAHDLAISNQALQDFAFVASHDLQEPLRKIQTFSDRLQVKYGSDLEDQAQDYLRRMQNAAQRMQILIHDLLAYSRISTQEQPFTSTDLNTTVRNVLSDLETLIEQTSAQIEIGALPTLEADPLQMRQLFQNLVGNALKFCQPGQVPAIAIMAEAGNQTVELRVQDNGIGFDLEHLERIFTPFQRLHGRSEYEGTGMGLAICRKIVERHRGQLSATSARNEGATFVVTLPYTQPQHHE
ncbi:MAG: ATP-binding protein [Cyanobacteria bacterium P01_A01_bin.17]